MKNRVAITQNYALDTIDRNFVLYRKVTVDPTKAPGYKPKSDEPAPETRTEWRSADLFYPLTADGLKYAILAAVVRDVNDATEARNIAELLAEYKAALDNVADAVYSAFETSK